LLAFRNRVAPLPQRVVGEGRLPLQPALPVHMDGIVRFKCLLWFCAVLLTALAYPIQVYTSSPYPSLLPYALIGIVMGLTMLPESQGMRRSRVSARRGSNIGLMVGIYAFLVLANTVWQGTLGAITETYAMNALAIYFLPIIWYYYFRRSASAPEIQAVLVAAALAGMIVGVFFAYDSYVKLALGELSEYSRRAFEYSMSRVDMTLEEANDMRIRLNDRSFGLLQSHAVSGAWVALGAFATLALLPSTYRLLRRTTIITFGTMIILGLNFTAIFAFAIITFLMEFGGLSMVRGRQTEILKNIVPLLVVVSGLTALSYWVAGDVMSQAITFFFTNQTDLALGRGEVERGLVLSAFDSIGGYLEHTARYPITLLVGDGFSTWGLAKGGDTGFTESMARLGLLFYVTVVFGLFTLVRSALAQIKAMSAGQGAIGGLDPVRLLRFSICVTLLVVISDGHYSIWTAKAVLPFVFFVLALFERYLDARRGVSFLGI
jgi:hypothetical protein